MLIMKQRLSICLEKELVKALDFIAKEKFNGLISRSKLIEYYLTENVMEEYKKLRAARARVLK